MAEIDIAPETLRSLLRYDFETGRLVWLRRPREMFRSDAECKRWNSRYAETAAFASVNGKGYFAGQIARRTYKAHRVIWAIVTGAWPTGQIDHVNGCRTDNRISNLRVVSHRENLMNQCIPSNNTSGVMGVRQTRPGGKWEAYITSNRRKVFLGLFERMDDAIAARAVALERLGYHPNHGREART